jgi:hypothetical protein
MAVELRTGRGLYRLTSAAPAADLDDATVLTLALERADGIERVAFRCRISRELLDSDNATDGENLLVRLAPWVEREFEAVREAALKTIRSERKLHEIAFAGENRGPF